MGSVSYTHLDVYKRQEQEHLLAALAQQQDGLIPQLLQTLGIDANAFAQAALQKVEALPRVTGSGFLDFWVSVK